MKAFLAKYLDVTVLITYHVIYIVLSLMQEFDIIIGFNLFIVLLYLINFISALNKTSFFKFCTVVVYILFLTIRLIHWPYQYFLLISSVLTSTAYLIYCFYPPNNRTRSRLFNNIFILFIFINSLILFFKGTVKKDNTIFIPALNHELKDSLLSNINHMNLRLNKLKYDIHHGIKNTDKPEFKAKLSESIIYNQNTYIQITNDTTYNKYFNQQTSIIIENINKSLSITQIDSLIMINKIIENKSR